MNKKIISILSAVTLLGGTVYFISQGGFGSLSSSVLGEEEVCSVESYTQQIQTVETNIRQAQEKIQTQQQSIQKNNENITTLNQTLRERQVALKEAQEDKKKCGIHRVLKICIEEADSQINNLQNSIKNHQSRIKENKAAISEKKENIETQQKNIKTLKKKIVSLSQKKTECANKMNTNNLSGVVSNQPVSETQASSDDTTSAGEDTSDEEVSIIAGNTSSENISASSSHGDNADVSTNNNSIADDEQDEDTFLDYLAVNTPSEPNIAAPTSNTTTNSSEETKTCLELQEIVKNRETSYQFSKNIQQKLLIAKKNIKNTKLVLDALNEARMVSATFLGKSYVAKVNEKKLPYLHPFDFNIAVSYDYNSITKRIKHSKNEIKKLEKYYYNSNCIALSPVCTGGGAKNNGLANSGGSCHAPKPKWKLSCGLWSKSIADWQRALKLDQEKLKMSDKKKIELINKSLKYHGDMLSGEPAGLNYWKDRMNQKCGSS